MKNRSQPFYCSIADKSVGISLRHGGGLQEPATVYVRCDERDCQHVDLNQAPCPLRIDMFADGSDDRVIQFLRERAGARHCYACLTETLGITHDQVRRASWRLKDMDGFAIRPSRCAVCVRRRVTIGFAQGTSLVAPPPYTPPVPERSTVELEDPETVEAAVRQLDARLRTNAGFGICAHCLAREIAIPVPVVREAMWRLEPHDAFVVRVAQCVSCLLTKRVICFSPQPDADDHAQRVIRQLVESPGLAFCPACVAFATDIPLAESKRLLGYLDGAEYFSRGNATCNVCGRWQSTVSFTGADGDAVRRADEVGVVLSGHTRYRGFRIDLLSFRTPEGWRPFVLIKGSTGALAPDLPPIVLEPTPTKLEADEIAAAKARAWIDKRLP